MKKKFFCKRAIGIAVCTIVIASLLCSCSIIPTKGNSDFVVEKDVLLQYSGKSMELDIPASICEIKGNAFSDSPNSSQITVINLGDNIQKIDSSAFAGLNSLSSVTVSLENPYYLSIDNYLIAKDGSTIFCFGNSKLDIGSLTASEDAEIKDIPFYEDGYEVIFKDAVLTFDTDSGLASDAIPTLEDALLVQISAKGHSIKFEDPISYYGNHSWSLFESDGAAVFCDLVAYCVGDTYVFTDDGIYEQHNSENVIYTDCNTPIVTFSLGVNDRLEYRCKPIKFVSFGEAGSELRYCVGLDEIYMENGTVEFKNAKPVYTAEKQTTIIQQYGKDELENMYNLSVEMLETESKTLEEYLEGNEKKYKAFDTKIIH